MNSSQLSASTLFKCVKKKKNNRAVIIRIPSHLTNDRTASGSGSRSVSSVARVGIIYQ